MMLCDFSAGLKCPRCGYAAKHRQTFRECVPPAPASWRLGDAVAAGLSAFGITKVWVSSLLGRECGCSKRQAALNDISLAAQRMARSAIRRAQDFYGLR